MNIQNVGGVTPATSQPLAFPGFGEVHTDDNQVKGEPR